MDLSQYGNVVQKLKQLVEDLSNCQASVDSSDDATYPVRTFTAFSVAISDYLRHLSGSLVKLERRIIQQDSTVTMQYALREISPRYKELEVLGRIFDDALSRTSFGRGTTGNATAADQASRLLDVLYRALNDLDELGTHDTVKVSDISALDKL